MTMSPRRENMIALLMFVVIMLLKISTIVALYARYNSHVSLEHHDNAHTHHIIKKQNKIIEQTNAQKYAH